MGQDKFVTKIVMLTFMAILVILAFIVLKSILISIIVGLILAYILNPVYKKIKSKVKSKNLSAALLIILVLLLIAVPFFLIVPNLARQTFDTYKELQGVNFIEPLQKTLPTLFNPELSNAIAVHLNNILSKSFNTLLTQITNFVIDLPNILLQLFVVFFVFFFSVRDSEKLKQYFFTLSPFSEPTEKKFLKEFRSITNGIIYGQFLIAILQALALGVGLFILGVPKVLVLTLITFLISIIPIFGPFLVWIPICIYLFLTGHIVKGIILALYGGLFVSSIDNIIRPYMLSKSSNLSIVVSLIGIIGGFYAFGIIGILLGPLILAYLMILIEFYKEGRLNELFKR